MASQILAAQVVKWVDGDTCDLMATKNFQFLDTTITANRRIRARLAIVDTPERGQPGWAEATAFCNEVLPVGSWCKVVTYDMDSFGRWITAVGLADLVIPGEGTTTVSSLLLQNGLAKVWQ